MAFKEVTNSGVLFRNEKKDKPNQPDYTGKINVEGKEFRLAGWIRDGKGGKFLSLKVSLAEERIGKSGIRQDPRPAPSEEIDDSIPF